MSAIIWPFAESRHFTSGVNAVGEIDGLALSGVDLGITATKAPEALLAQLELFAGGPLNVFVDSGAFSEVKFGKLGRRVVKPITAADWQRRFEVYRRVAAAYRSHAFVVAPDAVGDQAETLVRLERYAHVMRGLALHFGCNVIVPVQLGELSGFDFLVRALAILRLPPERVVIGVPAKKSATTPAQLRALVDELHAAGVVAPFHLLGCGPASKAWRPMRAAILGVFAGAVIYSDSVEIRRQVGRTNGRGGGPRRLTAAFDRARARGADGSEVKRQGLIEVGHSDARLEAQAARRAGWFDDELESAPGVPLEPGCIDYGPGGPFGDDVEAAVDLAA